ncbi:MAG: hypothetical protein JRG93_19975 [Deltaproteobacteria bacterium]|nr:hypothetical protein [Deltaproteobacteria bacterium]MBW2547857.1 hypothetical protein [Deltaproteobacteria bacterium]
MNGSSTVNLFLNGVPPKRPPILLIGHGRSGTSWIANTLAKSPERDARCAEFTDGSAR